MLLSFTLRKVLGLDLMVLFQRNITPSLSKLMYMEKIRYNANCIGYDFHDCQRLKNVEYLMMEDLFFQFSLFFYYVVCDCFTSKRRAGLSLKKT